VDSDVDVHAAGAAGFGPATQAHVFEKGLDFEGHSAHVGPGDAGAGIEIDAQLVGVVEIGRAHGVGVQFDAAEVDDPGESGGVIDYDFFGGAAGGKREGDGSEPGRPVGGSALLIERLAFGAVDEALENDGAVVDTNQGALGYGEIVGDEVEFRELRLL